MRVPIEDTSPSCPSPPSPIGELDHGLVVVLGDGAGMGLQHLHPGLLVRRGDLDLAVRPGGGELELKEQEQEQEQEQAPARPEKSRIQSVRSVGAMIIFTWRRPWSGRRERRA